MQFSVIHQIAAEIRPTRVILVLFSLRTEFANSIRNVPSGSMKYVRILSPGFLEAKRFISKVLPDGHLSLPEDMAEDIGKFFEVILIPLEEAGVYSYAELLAKEKGLSMLTEEDVERIIHESRGVK